MTRKILLRKQAQVLGFKRYYSGKSCPSGHNGYRYTSNGSCIECMKPTMITLNCHQCGDVFSARTREKGRIVKFCSLACYGKSIAKMKVCLHCGKDFYNYANKSFCSMECSGKFRVGTPLSDDHREALRGPRLHTRDENNHRWKGGKGSRPRYRSEYVEWRKGVFGRDDYTCTSCGERSRPGRGVYLEAHHIKRWVDYPEDRFDVNNGVTLCKDCHTDLHSKKLVK